MNSDIYEEFGVTYFLNGDIWKKQFFLNSQILIHMILKGLLSWDSCMFSLGTGEPFGYFTELIRPSAFYSWTACVMLAISIKVSVFRFQSVKNCDSDNFATPN